MADPSAAAREPETRRFLTCRVADRLYALPAGDVSEIVRAPAVAWAPHSPAALLGLANLRGAVIPVAGLRELLGMPAGGISDVARAVILRGASPVGLAVDAVEALVSIPADRLETRDSELDADVGEPLLATFVTDEGESARLVDLQGLLAAAFVPAAAPPLAHPRFVPAASDRGDVAAAFRRKLVTFEVAGQAFGLDLAAVREIVAMPASVAPAPLADAAVLGVMAYRDGLLPLLSLGRLLGLRPDPARQDSDKVVVTLVGAVLVGLVVDRMRAILPVDPALMDATPLLLAARAGGETRIASIYRAEGGSRLVSVLAPGQLFRDDVMQGLGDEDAAAPAEAAVGGDVLQVVVFRLGDTEFGLPVESVEEVGRAPDEITRVPNTPAFLEGVINLRGKVVPIVDQRRRFDMPAVEADEDRRLIVMRTERHRAGVIVDSVSEVLRTPRDRVEPPPQIVGETAHLVTGVVNLADAGRLVLLLDPAELLTRSERGLLDVFVATAPAAL